MGLLQLIIIFLAGCGLLAWGADRFVAGSAATARNLHIPPLIVGIILVGFATSFPEMLVSGLAAWHGDPELGVGNAIGSCIANIGLVLGCAALIKPLVVQSRLLRNEFPVLLLVMAFVALVVMQNGLNRIDGVLLVFGFVVVMGWLISQLRRKRAASDILALEWAEEAPGRMPMTRALFWLLVGFFLLYISSRMLIYSAVQIAHLWGVSELVIGLSIVAIGTSLPELAASIAGALKNEPDIAIGNIIGSNLFNLLIVLAMPALIAPGVMPPMALIRDIPILFAFTLGLFAMSYGFRGPGRINRWEGVLLLIGFIAYLAVLFANNLLHML